MLARVQVCNNYCRPEEGSVPLLPGQATAALHLIWMYIDVLCSIVQLRHPALQNFTFTDIVYSIELTISLVLYVLSMNCSACVPAYIYSI